MLLRTFKKELKGSYVEWVDMESKKQTYTQDQIKIF